WPDGHRFHDPSVDESIAYDPDAAKQLLADAGYPDGFTTDIYVIQSGSMPEVTQIMQQQLDEIGVTVNLVPAPSYVADFLEARKPGFGAVPTMSPGRLKLLQWTGESVGNTCGYDDDELNALQTELNGVSDSSDEAVEIWHRIEQKAVAEDALSIFLLFGASIIGYDTSTVGDPTAFPTTIIMPDPRATFVKAG
ncbi:MAG TPA: ABC transporter substrate-binding protein, partial [Acidimicrobiales bacterium]